MTCEIDCQRCGAEIKTGQAFPDSHGAILCPQCYMLRTTWTSIDEEKERKMNNQRADFEAAVREIKRGGGEKWDDGKVMWDIVPFECLDELAKIMTYGCKKYGKPSGWMGVPDMKDRYFSALMRHLSAYKQGEVYDTESKHRHLSHALCNVVFLLWKELQDE